MASEQGVPQAAYEVAEAAVAAEERLAARVALNVAYPAIRDQVLAEVREALTEASKNIPDAHRHHVFATLSPSEDTTAADPSQRVIDSSAEGSGAPLPEAEETDRRCCCSPGVTAVECPTHGGSI